MCVYACVSCVHRYGVPQQNYAPVAANTYHPGGANAYRVVKQPCSDNPVTLTCQRTVSAAMCNCLLVPLVPHVHVMVRAACSPPPVASGVDAQCTDPARECVFTCSPGLLAERGSPVGVCHRGTASFIGSAPLRCYGTSPLPLFRAVFATLNRSCCAPADPEADVPAFKMDVSKPQTVTTSVAPRACDTLPLADHDRRQARSRRM